MVKVLFDVLSAPKDSGGPYLHASELVLGWLEEFPDDELTVIGPSKFLDAAVPNNRLRRVHWPNETLAARIFGQMAIVPLISWLHPTAFLVVTSPVISPLARASRSYCFVHDWRHLTNPREFGLLQRLYRQSWKTSVSRARKVFCISTKTINETRELRPTARLVLAINGQDHPRRWTPPAASEEIMPKCILTFGHRNNKRPELVIHAYALISTFMIDKGARLVVVGATGSYRQELQALAERLHIADACDFPGFVPDDKLHAYYSSALVVVLASSDEGYGLPIAEALYLGISSIVMRDSGMQEIFGQQVTTAEPSPGSLASVLESVLTCSPQVSPGPTSRWAATVATVRANIESDQTH